MSDESVSHFAHTHTATAHTLRTEMNYRNNTRIQAQGVVTYTSVK